MSQVKLNTSTPLDSALREGYKGRAVEFVSDYAHRSILVKERAVIEEKLKVVHGPLYNGEAEQVLLFPLLEALRSADAESGKGKALVPTMAYQLAAAYALIFDISKISQSKDIANQITLSTLTVQPVVKAFLAQVDASNQSFDKASELWKKISDVLDGKLITQNPQNDKSLGTTPMSLLFKSLASSIVSSSVEENTMRVWDRLLACLRHGRGTPLDRGARKVMMSVHTEILMRLDDLIAAAETEDGLARQGGASNQEAHVGTAFIDAYTAMYWYLAYLTAIEEYDVIFPSSDVVVQSQAWVLIIKTQSAKLKKFFVDIAQVAAAYDIFTAMRLWEEVRDFYLPVLNQSLSNVSDMNTLWSEGKQSAEKMLSQFAQDQVSKMFSSLKAYLEADYLLPEQDFRVASSIMEIYKEPEMNAEKQYLALSGGALLSSISAVGEKTISISDRDLLAVRLSDMASAVEDAVALLKRSREMLQLSEVTDDVYHALLPSGVVWENPYALEGTVKDMRLADFTRKDPMQLAYEKYVVTPENRGNNTTIASLSWRFTDLLMKPFYKVPQMQQFADERSNESRIIWPGIGDLPVGDVISAAYVSQPVPACYTASRNANFVNNDFSAYLTLMSGHSGVTASSRDMFRKIAAILDAFESTYGRGILDALAATMFVYRQKAGSEYTIMEPSCPTIYGMPLKAMMEANNVKLSASTEEGIQKRSVRITLENGNSYQFVLHVKMPKAGPFVYIAYPYSKGVYVHIPLLRAVFEQNRSTIEKLMRISFTKNDNASDRTGSELDELINAIRTWNGKSLGGASFINTLGWAPYLINLPHLLCSYQDEENVLVEAEYRKYALLSVRVRYDDIERSIYVGGFEDNPVEILDMSDYEQAAYANDPSPISPANIVAAAPAEPETKEPERAEKEEKPDPTTIGAGDPNNPEAALNNAGKVTSAPVTGAGEVIVPPAGEPKEKVTTREVPAEALAGDALQQKEEVPDTESQKDKDRYWKKISESGEVEDVVKTEKCPDGYVPASEDEYREFQKRKQESEAIKDQQ